MQERREELMKEAAGPRAENTASFPLKLRPQSVHTFTRVGRVAEVSDVPNIHTYHPPPLKKEKKPYVLLLEMAGGSGRR